VRVDKQEKENQMNPDSKCAQCKFSPTEGGKREVLDPCCGSRMFWFDKSDSRALFCDIREEDYTLCDGRKLFVCPDEVIDFRSMPYEDMSFNLIVFDPPHLKVAGPKSWMVKKYGKLNKSTFADDLSAGFSECWRVLNKGGTLIFKWNETQIKLKDVLLCFPQKPLFGHTTTHNLKTHWIVFYKPLMDREGGKNVIQAQPAP